jgi:uncharacterized membrane protein
MLLNPHRDKHVKDFVEKKLIVRLRIFFFLIFILIDIIVLEISLGYINAWLAVGCLIVGILSGLIFVRRKRIHWDEETSRVIARMDKVGVLLLIIYIAFAITRYWFLHRMLSGNELTAVSVAFGTGAMISRVWSMRMGIRRILKQQKII